MRANGVICSNPPPLWYCHDPHLSFRKANKGVYCFALWCNWYFSCGLPAELSIISYFAYIHGNGHPKEQKMTNHGVQHMSDIISASIPLIAVPPAPEQKREVLRQWL